MSELLEQMKQSILWCSCNANCVGEKRLGKPCV